MISKRIPVKNRHAIAENQIVPNSSIQCPTWVVGIRWLFRGLFCLSKKAGLATVLLFISTSFLAAENVPANFYYYYQIEKGTIHYTNKPDSEMYSLLLDKQSAGGSQEVAAKAFEAKDNQEACGKNKNEITFRLIPPGFPMNPNVKKSVEQDATLAPSGVTNRKKDHSDGSSSEKPAHGKVSEENIMPGAVPRETANEKMLLASKTPDQFSLGASKHLQPTSGLKDKIDQLIMEAATKYRLSPSLLKAIIRAESNFNPRAVSPKGACGLMQIMPSNFPSLNIEDPFDPRQNIMGGAKYLRQMFDYFNLDHVKAIAAYNAGPGNVKKANGIPDLKETRLYVKKVLNYLEHYKNRK